MKTIKLFFALASAILIINACKKEDIQRRTSIVGLWKGKSAAGTGNNFTHFYAVLFKADSTCRIYDFNFSAANDDTALATYKTNSTYSINNGVLTSTYSITSSELKSITGTVDINFSKIQGAWTQTLNGQNNGSGEFFLK